MMKLLLLSPFTCCLENPDDDVEFMSTLARKFASTLCQQSFDNVASDDINGVSTHGILLNRVVSNTRTAADEEASPNSTRVNNLQCTEKRALAKSGVEKGDCAFF
jgi:hypothetical protein